MNKLIQTIALTMAVCSPLSLIALVASASAHHTPSHVSTVAVETSINKKKKTVKKMRRGAKPKVTSSSKKKTTAPAASTAPETGMPSSESTPPAGTTPPAGSPPPTTAPTKPSPSPSSKIDPMMGNPATKQGRTTQLPPANSGIPNIPLEVPGNVPNPAGNTPSIPRPNFPSVPGK